MENLIAWNTGLHSKLDEYVKQDDEIIYLIKNKRRVISHGKEAYRSIGRY